MTTDLIQSFKPVDTDSDYFSVQRNSANGKVTIIGMELDLTQDYLNKSEALAVYADVIHLKGDLSTEGKPVTLNARKIIATKRITIDTSGPEPKVDFKPGVKAASGKYDKNANGNRGERGTDGRPGSEGAHGGDIVLAAESIELADTLTLIANGGRGGRGEDGGDGAEGSPGASGDDARSDSEFGKSYMIKNGQRGGNGGHGGDGGDGGKSGSGGNSGHIFVGAVNAVDSTKINMISNPGKKAEKADGGAAGKGAEGGQGGRYGSTAYIWSLATYYSNEEYKPGDGPFLGKFLLLHQRAPSGRHGIRGRAGLQQRAAADGKRGRLGEKNDKKAIRLPYSAFWIRLSESVVPAAEGIQTYLTRNRAQARREVPQLHLLLVDRRVAASYEQRVLTLHAIRRAYLDRNWDRVGTLLNWLVKTTPNQEAVTLFENLRNSHAEPQYLPGTNLHLLSPELASWQISKMTAVEQFETARKEVIEISPQWVALRNSAEVLLGQLAHGLDYFGLPEDWTPLAPLKHYHDHGHNLITAATAVEELYEKFKKQTKDQEKQRATALEVLAAGERQLQSLKEQLTEWGEKKAASDKSSQGLVTQINAKRKDLETTAAKFVRELEQALTLRAGMSVFEIVVDGISFAGGAKGVLGALKEGGAIVEALHSFNQTGDIFHVDAEGKSEEELKKAQEARKSGVDKVVTDAKSVVTSGKALWKSGSDLVSLVGQLNEAGTKFGYKTSMLSMTREEFDTQLKSAYDHVPSAAAEYKAAFNGFVDVAEAYHRQRETYQSQILTENKTRGDIASLQADNARLARLTAGNFDPGLPAIRTYLYNLYLETKLALEEFIYEEYQAFRYYALRELTIRERKTDKVAELAELHGRITNELTKVLKEADRPRQDMPDCVISIDAQSHPDFFRLLHENGQATLSLNGRDDLVQEAFAGKANVRISACHVLVPELHGKPGKVHISITHHGRSEFLDATGKEWAFAHSQSRLLCEYDLKAAAGKTPKSIIRSATGGNLGDDRNRILVSPLAVWTIGFPKKDARNRVMNKGIKVKEITRLDLHFKGMALAFD